MGPFIAHLYNFVSTSLLIPINFTQILSTSPQDPHHSSSGKPWLCEHITYVIKNSQQNSERSDLACQTSWLLADDAWFQGQRQWLVYCNSSPKHQHLYHFPEPQFLQGDINWAIWSLTCITGEEYFILHSEHACPFLQRGSTISIFQGYKQNCYLL